MYAYIFSILRFFCSKASADTPKRQKSAHKMPHITLKVRGANFRAHAPRFISFHSDFIRRADFLHRRHAAKENTIKSFKINESYENRENQKKHKK